MTLREKAIQLRRLIEQAAQSLDDETALQGMEIFPKWEPGKEYKVDVRVRDDEQLWRCLQAHTSQIGWEPGAAPSLWAKVLIPDPEQIYDWVQPDSTNPYSRGDKVRHNGKIWVSDIDGNVWEPGVYGWTEAVP